MSKQPAIIGIAFGFYPGILFGARTYPGPQSTQYVIYIPFFDLAITKYHAEE
tara:strand:- start:1015 stop:1170 length:156 start_codon:yes stop_codon:yes gene_type:complete